MPPPAVHENASDCAVVEEDPTTWPLLLTAIASLLLSPGRVPRSTIPPAAVHEVARSCPLTPEAPTT